MKYVILSLILSLAFTHECYAPSDEDIEQYEAIMRAAAEGNEAEAEGEGEGQNLGGENSAPESAEAVEPAEFNTDKILRKYQVTPYARTGIKDAMTRYIDTCSHAFHVSGPAAGVSWVNASKIARVRREIKEDLKQTRGLFFGWTNFGLDEETIQLRSKMKKRDKELKQEEKEELKQLTPAEQAYARINTADLKRCEQFEAEARSKYNAKKPGFEIMFLRQMCKSSREFRTDPTYKSSCEHELANEARHSNCTGRELYNQNEALLQEVTRQSQDLRAAVPFVQTALARENSQRRGSEAQAPSQSELEQMLMQMLGQGAANPGGARQDQAPQNQSHHEVQRVQELDAVLVRQKERHRQEEIEEAIAEGSELKWLAKEVGLGKSPDALNGEIAAVKEIIKNEEIQNAVYSRKYNLKLAIRHGSAAVEKWKHAERAKGKTDAELQIEIDANTIAVRDEDESDARYEQQQKIHQAMTDGHDNQWIQHNLAVTPDQVQHQRLMWEKNKHDWALAQKKQARENELIWAVKNEKVNDWLTQEKNAGHSVAASKKEADLVMAIVERNKEKEKKEARAAIVTSAILSGSERHWFESEKRKNIPTGDLEREIALAKKKEQARVDHLTAQFGREWDNTTSPPTSRDYYIDTNLAANKEAYKIAKRVESAMALASRAGPMKNPAAHENMRNFIYTQLQARPEPGTKIVPGVPDFRVAPEILSAQPSKLFRMNPIFSTTGEQLLKVQKSARVYYDSSVYSSPEEVKEAVEGKALTPAQAFKAKSKIVVSDNYMLYGADGNPTTPLPNEKPFKIFSHAGVNAYYGKGGHDNEDYKKFVQSEPKDGQPGVIKEVEFSAFLKKNLNFQLTAMEREGVEVPVLVALGGGAFSKGYQPRYSELVAQAYKEVLENGHFNFKHVVFSLPQFSASDNLQRYDNVFNPLEVSSPYFPYKGKIPYSLSEKDAVDVARQLANESGLRAGIINPADSYSVAGMYWDSDKDIALEESLAQRTTLLLTQHLRINPHVLDSANYRRM